DREVAEIGHAHLARAVDDARHQHVVEQDDADHEREQRHAGRRQRVAQAAGGAASLRAGGHALRNLAANAPSQPCMCGSTRMKPSSVTTVSGTAPAALSTVQPGCSARKRATTCSVSSGSNEHTL